VGIVIAAKPVVGALDASNGGAPTNVISAVQKDGWIIATASGSIGPGGRVRQAKSGRA
jgi:hypothetical protein